MKINATLFLTLRDPDGKIVLKRKLRSRSYLRAFIKLLFATFSSVASSAPDTANVSKALAANASWTTTAAAAVTTRGFRVGTGTTPVALTNYALETPIAHGIGAGQLDHGASIVESYTETSPSFYFHCRRSFNNGSGANIVVNEVGLYAYDATDAAYFCALRDVIAAITVVPGQTLTTEYQIKISL